MREVLVLSIIGWVLLVTGIAGEVVTGILAARNFFRNFNGPLTKAGFQKHVVYIFVFAFFGLCLGVGALCLIINAIQGAAG